MRPSRGWTLFSIARMADMGIRNADAEHIAWWHEAAGQVMPHDHVLTITTMVSDVKLIVRGPDGQPKT